MAKLKLAFYWAASCGGCEIAVLDINEKILDIASIADIVFWPVAMDTKYKDVEAMEDGSIDVCFFNGAIRTSENEHLARILREKSKLLIAFGSCACHGGIPGLANLSSAERIFKTVYLDAVSTENPELKLPRPKSLVKEGELELPRFYNSVTTLDGVVAVDHYLPGCPPPVKLILSAVDAIASNSLPQKGSVLGPERSICDECKRKRTEKKIAAVRRVHEIRADPEKCLLEQGIICLGPATRGGCDAKCIDGNMPCTGCMGPCPGALDQGAKMMSALASVLALETEEGLTEEEVLKLFSQIKDPVGTFYKHTLPKSIMKGSVAIQEVEVVR